MNFIFEHFVLKNFKINKTRLKYFEYFIFDVSTVRVAIIK